jgi:hypothetical protein
MKFGPEWNHGPRLVFRRVYQIFVGPIPSVHFHRDDELWQFAILPFVKWQRPVTDSKYHLNRLGVDVLFGPWTLCAHWVDN